MRALVFLYVFIVFMSYSCCYNKNKLYEKNIVAETVDTSKTISLLSDNYYKFIYLTEFQYRIEWGNKLFNSISKDTFNVDGSGTLYLLGSSDDFIILQQSSGMNCKYSVILPLSPQIEEQIYFFTIALDIKNNLIAYLPEDQENFIILKNYLNGKVMEIEEKDLCPATFSGDCIDTCFFDMTYLVIKWQGSKWQTTQLDTKERKIKINLK